MGRCWTPTVIREMENHPSETHRTRATMAPTGGTEGTTPSGAPGGAEHGPAAPRYRQSPPYTHLRPAVHSSVCPGQSTRVPVRPGMCIECPGSVRHAGAKQETTLIMSIHGRTNRQWRVYTMEYSHRSSENKRVTGMRMGRGWGLTA